MRRMTATTSALAALALALAGTSPAVGGEKKLGWANTAELGLVATSGNAETTTIGFKDTLTYAWEKALVTVKAGTLRTESLVPRRLALATLDPNDPAFDPNDDYRLEDGDRQTTAENYYLNGRYDRIISPRFLWHVGAGWERNELAGVRDRYIGFAGVGNVWRDDDKIKFRTTYAATYTNQKDVVDNPGLKDSFFGLRIASDYLHKFGEGTTYVNTLVIDDNLDETEDWRADMINSIAVSMTRNLALKASLQTLWDNLPSLERLEILVEDPATGDLLTTGRRVDVELEEFDMIFTTSLVMTF